MISLSKVGSHPTMGAWIEITILALWLCKKYSRTPRWVRGLKLDRKQFLLKSILSHPTMGAWIEIINSYELDDVDIVAPHDGCVD